MTTRSPSSGPTAATWSHRSRFSARLGIPLVILAATGIAAQGAIPTGAADDLPMTKLAVNNYRGEDICLRMTFSASGAYDPNVDPQSFDVTARSQFVQDVPSLSASDHLVTVTAYWKVYDRPCGQLGNDVGYGQAEVPRELDGPALPLWVDVR